MKQKDREAPLTHKQAAVSEKRPAIIVSSPLLPVFLHPSTHPVLCRHDHPIRSSVLVSTGYLVCLSQFI